MPSSLPINLSLSEDERSPNRSSSDCTSPRHAKSMAAAQNLQKSPEDDEEQLYEYFPLSLDDWWVPTLPCALTSLACPPSPTSLNFYIRM